jgi:hypothetical protein
MPDDKIIEQWRQLAKDALEAADKATSDTERALLTKIAEHYQSLIEHREKSKNAPGK